MMSESTEKLQYIYRLQQSKLVNISHLTENLDNIRENLEAFSSEHKMLTGQLQDCTNKSRAVIRRLEKKSHKEENNGNDDNGGLSTGRRKSILQSLQTFNEISSSAAEEIYGFSVSHKQMAELLDLSVITVKHFLWRERIFMAIILGGHDNEMLKQVSVRTCALGRWYDGRGKKAYSHLPAYRLLGGVHSRYHEMVNDIVDKGVEKMTFRDLSAELAKLEMLSQQLVGLIGQIQQHIRLLQKISSPLLWLLTQCRNAGYWQRCLSFIENEGQLPDNH
ncbi:CZB domain-containing protein [Salmonella enterica]|nr:CZB domain-containing protein [Salmonella enterica]EKK6346508.1 CZB domain-containing protein [Salmonella enterica]ELO7821421.1 CZB domain-containing protein [Salmonella enterica]ELR6878437.1 CZB domain-containing protein [Salmonella enterica]MJK42729.1 chemotaxis protein [Salmonella enterica subsp. diarizonae]